MKKKRIYEINLKFDLDFNRGRERKSEFRYLMEYLCMAQTNIQDILFRILKKKHLEKETRYAKYLLLFERYVYLNRLLTHLGNIEDRIHFLEKRNDYDCLDEFFKKKVLDKIKLCSQKVGNKSLRQ